MAITKQQFDDAQKIVSDFQKQEREAALAIAEANFAAAESMAVELMPEFGDLTGWLDEQHLLGKTWGIGKGMSPAEAHRYYLASLQRALALVTSARNWNIDG